jgi:peptide/nickel transport system substrate-binding protein
MVAPWWGHLGRHHLKKEGGKMKPRTSDKASLFFFLFLFSFTIFFSGSQLAGAATPENELVIGSPSVIETFDPAQHMSSGSKKGENLVYNNLVGYERESAKIGPELAESWTISPDGKEIVFKLRKGVKFHDGTPFNAEAVKFNWDRMLQADLSAAGKYKTYADLNSVEVVDDQTVRFKQTNPTPSVMDFFAGGLKFYINSPTYIKAHSTAEDPLALKWMNTHECGTGPFELMELEPDTKYVFKKFAGYWGGTPEIKPAPKVEKITYKIVKDPSVMRMMIEKGDIDIAEKLPADAIDQLMKTPGIKVKMGQAWKIVFTIMNCQKPPFDNVKVRQAISYAVNYDELIKHVEKNRATRIAGTMMEGFLGYDPKLFKYNLDLKKAKQLMKEAGFPNGFKTTLLYSPDRYAGFELMSVMMQSHLKKIGIDLTLQKMAWPTQVDTMKKGAFDMALQTWTADYPDPVEQTFFFFSPKTFSQRWNWSYWKNDKAEELCDAMMTEFNAQKRADIVKEIEKLGVENAVYVYLYQVPYPIAMRDNVEDAWFHPGIDWIPSPVHKKVKK